MYLTYIHTFLLLSRMGVDPCFLCIDGCVCLNSITDQHVSQQRYRGQQVAEKFWVLGEKLLICERPAVHESSQWLFKFAIFILIVADFQEVYLVGLVTFSIPWYAVARVS